MPDFINLYSASVLCFFIAAGAFVAGRRGKVARDRAKLWFIAADLCASLIPIGYFALHSHSVAFRLTGEGLSGGLLGFLLWVMFLEIDYEEDKMETKSNHTGLIRVVLFVGIGAFTLICAAEAIRFFIPPSYAQGSAPPASTGPSQSNSPCGTIIGGSNYGPISPDCRTYNYGPPRTRDGLYQRNTKVGSVEGVSVSADNKTVTLMNPRFDQEFVDFQQPLELQGVKILCGGLKGVRTGPGMSIGIAGSFDCNVIGPRS